MLMRTFMVKYKELLLGSALHLFTRWMTIGSCSLALENEDVRLGNRGISAEVSVWMMLCQTK